jgi:ABC-2 type transport system permease protein
VTTVTSTVSSTVTSPVPARYGLRQVVAAELTKLASLRSTLWTLLVMFLGMVGVTLLSIHGALHHPRQWYQGFDPTNQSMGGLALGTLTIGVLGVLAVTGEYGSGTIRSTLAGGPRRGLLLVGKVLVVGALALVVSEVFTFVCFFVGQAVLASGGAPSATIVQPGVLRAVALSGAFLALLGLGALGLGVVFRHTAGALAGYVGLTFLIPLLMSRLPGNPARFTPIPILANSVSAVVPQYGQLSAPVGFALTALYATVILAVGAVVLVRRDA